MITYQFFLPRQFGDENNQSIILEISTPKNEISSFEVLKSYLQNLLSRIDTLSNVNWGKWNRKSYRWFNL